MYEIWKFPFKTSTEVTIAMPSGAEVLSLQVQGGMPCLWALVEPERPTTPHRFRIYGTGKQMEKAPDGVFIGTYQHPGQVCHVWDVTGREVIEI